MQTPARAKLLSALLGPEIAPLTLARDPEVVAITADSRQAAPGVLFAALPGTKVDGARFAADAVGRGAVAVLADADAQLPPLDVPVLRAADPRRALALLAARFYRPQPAVAVAVTGTSGKTSVADFTRQIFARCGRKAASLGTLGVIKPSGAAYGSLTTPDPVTLAATLAGLSGEGITHVAFEASSHGLDQRRLDGVALSAAAFTNLGRDHLDYHATIEEYFAAKLRLFDTLLPQARPAVVNADGDRADAVAARAAATGHEVHTVGRGGTLLALQGVRADGFAQVLTVAQGGGAREVRLPLPGAYQVENALVAAGLAIAAGEQPDDVLEALQSLQGVPGRLDVVGEVRGGLVVVDYAHKPEALVAALAALRPFARGRLVCVFGCGGDRDKGKRPLMGRIAVHGADVVIVTDDNPRSEQPAQIRAEILAGASGAREIGDRAEAIETAVAMIGPGDVLLVAGKGHETGQIVGDKVLPFSDHAVARGAIEREQRRG